MLEDLPYHNQLFVIKTIKNNDQMNTIIDLIKMGLSTEGSVDLFTVIYSSFQANQAEKSTLLQLIDEYILHNSRKNTVVNMINGPTLELNCR